MKKQPRKAQMQDLRRGVTVWKQMNPNGPWTKTTLGVGDLNQHNKTHLWQYLIDRGRVLLEDPQLINWEEEKQRRQIKPRNNTLFD